MIMQTYLVLSLSPVWPSGQCFLASVVLAPPIVLLGTYVNAPYIPRMFLPSHYDGNWSLADISLNSNNWTAFCY